MIAAAKAKKQTCSSHARGGSLNPAGLEPKGMMASSLHVCQNRRDKQGPRGRHAHSQLLDLPMSRRAARASSNAGIPPAAGCSGAECWRVLGDLGGGPVRRSVSAQRPAYDGCVLRQHSKKSHADRTGALDRFSLTPESGGCWKPQARGANRGRRARSTGAPEGGAARGRASKASSWGD